PLLEARAIDLAPLQPANCGFDVVRDGREGWSEIFACKYAGQPIKPVVIERRLANGETVRRQGEFVVTATGVEGSLIYALSAELRDEIAARGGATIHLDLAPNREIGRLARDLAQPRGKRTLSEHLRRHAGIDGVKAGLLYELLTKDEMQNPERLARVIKALPLHLLRARPLDEAISTAGGVRFAALNASLMLEALPGTFCAGEMIDWEAPTGGYLLTACFASGKIAGHGAAEWAARSN
ncbi:MAG: TIGR03862 family flavoprotein, partial [Rudaea sp.]|nr:TIGR03862 family flavoprotein [Rudaea sp.]